MMSGLFILLGYQSPGIGSALPADDCSQMILPQNAGDSWLISGGLFTMNVSLAGSIGWVHLTNQWHLVTDTTI